jgi:hypothetical protein
VVSATGSDVAVGAATLVSPPEDSSLPHPTASSSSGATSRAASLDLVTSALVLDVVPALVVDDPIVMDRRSTDPRAASQRVPRVFTDASAPVHRAVPSIDASSGRPSRSPVLATNFEKNVDDAFIRRLHVRVEFALPGVEERRAIWRNNLPPGAPVVDVDVDWLAEQFELSGASIRNAAVNAAFAAAASGTSITMDCAVLGVAREFRKSGRLLKEKDFGKYYDLVAE